MFFDQQQRLLQLRRQQLQQRSALLRSQLARETQVLQSPLALADRVGAGWRWLRAHPQWLGVAVLVLVVRRPRRAVRLASRLWVGWRLWQRLLRWRATLAPPLPALTSRLAAAAKSWQSVVRPPR